MENIVSQGPPFDYDFPMYKHLYSRFLAAHNDELHFASHSHHYWPDVTREAHLNYWDDSCRYVDNKWQHIYADKVPYAQKLIAQNLGISAPEQIVFAPNTHEFVFRLLSSLDWSKKNRILTTDSEFYSFDRQINRLAEMANFEIVKVPTLPIDTFEERFEKELATSSWNMVFLSHVFFNSGLACDIHRLARVAAEKQSQSMFVIDGYHGFMALPTDLSGIEANVFYLAGSYKYAQGGEGACFLYVPPKTRHRPFHTGWFAELSHLTAVGQEVGYPTDALQYAGSTMDFSALYRLIAVLEKFQTEGLSVQQIHRHVQLQQESFLEALFPLQHPLFNISSLMKSMSQHHGHFLTFELPSSALTQETVKKLAERKLLTDSRGNRLRFGFGLYHDLEDIKKAVALIRDI